MIEEQAYVISVDEGVTWVEAERRSSCSTCGASKGCGTGSLSKVLGNRPLRMRALNDIGAEAGEEVIIGLREGALLKGSLAVYMVPLLSMIGGALLAAFLAPQWDVTNPDGLTILFGGAGLGISMLWLRRFGHRIGNDDRYQARILRRLGPALNVSRVPISLDKLRTQK